MPFLTLSNADIQFAEKKLTWRSYTITKALPTTKQVEIIDRKEFAKAALDEHVEAFVVHVTSLSTMAIHPAQEAQIASLVIEEVQIPSEYSDFSDVFSEERASTLPEATDLNQHAIELREDQPRQRLHSAFKVTRWCSYPLRQKARRLSAPDMAISNIRWCRSDYPMLRRASRVISIGSWPRSLTSSSFFIWMTSSSILRIRARATWRPWMSIS